MARAIAASRYSPTLQATFTDAECNIADLDSRVEAQRPPDMKATTEEIRDHALKSILDLKSQRRSVTQKTKVKLAQRVQELVLTPGKRDGEEVYEVSGEWGRLAVTEWLLEGDSNGGPRLWAVLSCESG